MDGKQLESVSRAYARRIHRTVVFLLAFAVLSFAGASARLLRAETARSIQEQAQLCAAAITAVDEAAYAERFEALRNRFDNLVAVAVLDPFGGVRRVYPDRTAHREVVRAVLAEADGSIQTTSPTHGDTCRIASGLVRIGGAFSPYQESLLVLIEQNLPRTSWIGATVVFGLFVGAMALICIRSLRRWFDRQVAGPLNLLALGPQELGAKSAHIRRLSRPRWRETEQIAARFLELAESLNETDARNARLERESEHKMQRRQRQFDQQLRRAKTKALTDPLTGLRNRTFLDEELERLFEEIRSDGKQLSAVMIDLDNFKSYNDAHGHQVGDALLRFVGALLRGSIRPSDHAVRYGGDEFLLLLPGASEEQAATIAERLVKLFAQYTFRLRRGGGPSLSAGVAATTSTKCKDGYTLVSKADSALYAAKASGKNRITLASANQTSKKIAQPRAPLQRS